MFTGPREYVLVWGSKRDDDESQEEDSDDAAGPGDGLYEVTPLAAINRLLKKHASRLLDADDGVCAEGERCVGRWPATSPEAPHAQHMKS